MTAFEITENVLDILGIVFLWWALVRIERLEKAVGK